jgi:transcriptional regulator with XRE-family HTH domain
VKLESEVSFISKLITDKKARNAFVYQQAVNGIPFQMRAMRQEREWTQGDLAREADKPRNVITRLEDPNYGKLTLKTLFEIASGFDVALLIKFVPFSRLLREYKNVSPSALGAKSISKERNQLLRNARAIDAKTATEETSGGIALVENHGLAQMALYFHPRPDLRSVKKPEQETARAEASGSTALYAVV